MGKQYLFRLVMDMLLTYCGLIKSMKDLHLKSLWLQHSEFEGIPLMKIFPILSTSLNYRKTQIPSIQTFGTYRYLNIIG